MLQGAEKFHLNAMKRFDSYPALGLDGTAGPSFPKLMLPRLSKAPPASYTGGSASAEFRGIVRPNGGTITPSEKPGPNREHPEKDNENAKCRKEPFDPITAAAPRPMDFVCAWRPRMAAPFYPVGVHA